MLLLMLLLLLLLLARALPSSPAPDGIMLAPPDHSPRLVNRLVRGKLPLVFRGGSAGAALVVVSFGAVCLSREKDDSVEPVASFCTGTRATCRCGFQCTKLATLPLLATRLWPVASNSRRGCANADAESPTPPPTGPATGTTNGAAVPPRPQSLHQGDAAAPLAPAPAPAGVGREPSPPS